MTDYINYFLNSKNSRLTKGHIKSNLLFDKILKHDHSTAYACYFDLDEAYLKYEWDTHKVDQDNQKVYEYVLNGQKPKTAGATCNGKTFTKYEGTARPALDLVSFDFDCEDDPEASLEDVKDFIDFLGIKNLILFYSGSKGFHLLVPFGYFNLTANEHLPNQLKDLAKHLAPKFPTLDTSIYNYNRKFRVPFSQHEKTGRYKNAVDISDIDQVLFDDILEACESPRPFNFVDQIDFNVEPLEVLSKAIEMSSRANYEIEKERAGTIDKPSPFEKYDNKLCIRKLLESRCDDVGRNNAALRIVNDYYRTGKTREACEKDLIIWANNNALPWNELSTIISNIYDRAANYNFGCQDEIKALYCSAKCSIWKRLDPDKRPITVDMPLNSLSDAQGKKQPAEFEVVERVLLDVFGCSFDERYKKFEGGTICKQGKDLFVFKENFWQHLTPDQIDLIRIKFNAIYDNILTNRRIENIFKMFMMYVPSKPKDIDMFVPKSNAANFKNGTLVIKTDLAGKYSFDFREHRKEDYLTFKINYDYDPTFQEKNQLFEDWLLNCVDDDQEQFDLVQEIFGASLAPHFPHLCFFIGTAGTGKSTCIKVLLRMHSNDQINFSRVSPHDFNDYNMTSMAGKLLNVVMDIATDKAIRDDVVKQIEDREPVRIKRKFLDDLYAPLPALHVFGGNKMPPTHDGYSGAMGRRTSILNFNKAFTGKKNRNIANVLFDESAQGVVNFAIQGLMRLAIDNQGFFSGSKVSKDKVNKWSHEEDIIELFLTDLESEGFEVLSERVRLVKDENKKINRSRSWEIFNAWQDEGLPRNKQLGRNEFYKLLEVKGHCVKKYDGIFKVFGLGELTGKDLGEALI